MSAPFNLFEVSWEVCNKVGGIHTVVSSKARTLVERFGDDYVAVGPWLLSEADAQLPFRDEPGFDAFIEACRTEGVPVRVGRWLIPGEPRTVLVAFSELYAQSDGILAGLWERHQVDSLAGGWDYLEPVLFAHAAGIVIRRWWGTYRDGLDRRAVAQFHEWMTGAGLLYLRDEAPEIATVFTTHATVLGRASAGQGREITGRAPSDLAAELGVGAKHSMESASASEADVFTTVSVLTADEAEIALGRRPEPILPNGIDLAVIDALVGDVSREQAASKLRDLAARFLGADIGEAALVGTSGRYEFHNKGIDVLLEAAGLLNSRPGRPIVLFILVPAGNSGLRNEVLARLTPPTPELGGPIGIATHNLFDPQGDPIERQCQALGLTNATDARVKVIHIPLYLHQGDGLLGMTYEAVLQAMDLTCFPSAYEPWGYTPQESLAVGVPTVTSDSAGFGRWCLAQGLGPADGVHVLYRHGVPDREAAERLSYLMAAHLAEPLDRAAEAAACRRTAARTEWSDLIANSDVAFRLALDRVDQRDGHVAAAYVPVVTVAPQDRDDRQRPRLIPFKVSAPLPDSLADLARLSRNLWWAGDAQAQALFEDLAPERWAAYGHNPVALLRRVSVEDLAAHATDPAYVERLGAVMTRFDAYVNTPARSFKVDDRVVLGPDRPVAYLCAEFGLHESLPIYSGGLGVLAGDHLKAASDLALPLVAVGLYYRQGYFRQQLTATGDQMAEYVELDPGDLPLEPVRDEAGNRLEITLAVPGGQVAVQVWRASVGRVPLYLLDTNVPTNRPEDRDIARVLYGGDSEMRLRQEIVLGKGGVRVLRALGIRPAVFHLNEGHAALAGLARISRLLADEGLTFDEAREVVRTTTVFTTHTPVAAGHDRFHVDLMRRYFADVPEWIGLPWERFYGLGEEPGAPGLFNMTGLALNLSRFVNGVSQLHRDVSRELLHGFWPGRLACEVPIAGITNGVHLPTWTHPDIAAVVGAGGRAVTGDDFAGAANAMDDAQLWEARRAARRRLLAGAREHVARRFVARFDSPRLLADLLEGLETEDALVIGFARRFAPYKRAHLLFKDPDRLAALLDRPDRPVRILLAGKAHPNDKMGQDLLASLVRLSRDRRFAGKVVFLEDHDIALGRLLVQGADVWLNTPTHLLEASGTSGMKAAANGALNLSILDGWWAEGYSGDNGWAIGGARVFDNQDLQDELDSANLYDILEDEVLPLFFLRDPDGLPQAWLTRVKQALVTIPPRFGADRMVGDYLRRAYVPRADAGSRLGADGFGALRQSVAEASRVRRAFPDTQIVNVRVPALDDVRSGDPITVEVDIRLSDLTPDDVTVELVLERSEEAVAGARPGMVGSLVGGMGARGVVSWGSPPRAAAPCFAGTTDGAAGDAVTGDGTARPARIVTVPLRSVRRATDGMHTFAGRHVIAGAGSFAYGVRVRRRTDPGVDDPLDPMIWA